MVKDVINNPAHYTYSEIEPIDVIDTWELDFELGNALKYIARCEHKGKKIEDLKKAIWYINREIKKCSEEKPQTLDSDGIIHNDIPENIRSIDDPNLKSWDLNDAIHNALINAITAINLGKGDDFHNCIEDLVRFTRDIPEREGMYNVVYDLFKRQNTEDGDIPDDALDILKKIVKEPVNSTESIPCYKKCNYPY